MKKLVRFLTDIRVLAIFFSILLWFYVVGTQGPTIEKTVSGIPVVPVNVPSGSFVSGSLGTVELTVEGPGKVVVGLKDADFSAIVDLSNKSTGVHIVSVEVRAPTASVVVKSVNPSKLSVALEKLSTRTIPVSVEFVNSSPAGFVPDLPVISPSSVTVSGPESSVAMISKAYITVDLSTIKEAGSFTLPVKLEMKQGALQQDIYVNPSTCVVEISQSKTEISVTVPITPVISGVPQKGFGVKAVSATPNFVTVIGLPEDVKKVQGVLTPPIDVSKMTKNTTIEIALVPPEGTRLAVEKCRIDITVQPVVTSKLSIPLSVLHDPNKLTSTSVSAVEVLVSGFRDVIDAIDKEKLKASVDATGLETGTYILPVLVSGLPQDVIVNETAPREVQVTVY